MHALRNCESSVIALISVGSSFHQEGARGEKALFLVEARLGGWGSPVGLHQMSVRFFEGSTVRGGLLDMWGRAVDSFKGQN